MGVVLTHFTDKPLRAYMLRFAKLLIEFGIHATGLVHTGKTLRSCSSLIFVPLQSIERIGHNMAVP